MLGKIISIHLLALSAAIVLDSTSETFKGNGRNYKQLADLLLEEKKSRLELERRLQTLESGLEACNTSLVQSATRNKEAFQEIKAVLDFEMSARREIERTCLNQSSVNNAFLKRNAVLDSTVRNLSEKLDLLSKENVILRHQVKNVSQESSWDRGVAMKISNDLTYLNQSLLNSMNGLQSNIINDHVVLSEVKRKQGSKSAFSARLLNGGISSGSLTFSGIIDNIGNQYSSQTGKFTCVYPGIYFFDLTIYQTVTSTHTLCFIRQNGNNVMYVVAASDPRYPRSYHSASNSVVLQLKKGDSVDVGGCTNISTIDGSSSFTGFLISSD